MKTIYTYQTNKGLNVETFNSKKGSITLFQNGAFMYEYNIENFGNLDVKFQEWQLLKALSEWGCTYEKQVIED
jgi:hypothetical protein